MTFPTSSAWPIRPIKVPPLTISELKRPLASPSRKILVSMGPLFANPVNSKVHGCFCISENSYGKTQLTLTPFFPYSAAVDSVKPMTPNLLDAYAAFPGSPRSPEVLDTFTIAPFEEVRCLSCERIQFIVPVRLIDNILSQAGVFCWASVSGSKHSLQCTTDQFTMFSVISPSPSAIPAMLAAPCKCPNSEIVESIHD